MKRLPLALFVAGILASLPCQPAGAQSSGAAPPATVQAAPASNPLDFSGVIFGNYQYRTDSAARAAAGGHHPNQFNIERVYLTFRMPVGDRASIRATTDVFQSTAGGYYGGWTIRLKYAWLQYDLLRDIGGMKGFNLTGRLGMLNNVVIDHEEQIWPRYLGTTGVDRFGFFSSSDVGAAALVSLPNKWGEAYATLVNGPGFTSGEVDVFKDFAARLSITPFAKRTDRLQTFVVSPWFYRGFTASRFAAGGTGQLAPVSDALARNRWGLLAALKDPKVTVGAHYAQRVEGFESGLNTSASPRIVAPDSTGTLFSAYTIIKPLSWQYGKNTAKAGVVLRFDQFTPRTSVAGHQQLMIAGLHFEPTSRTTLSLDRQSLTSVDYTGPKPPANASWFLHWSASF